MDYNQEIENSEKMLHGVLFSLQIFKEHPDFEDYLQILRLSLFEWLTANPEKSMADYQGYLFQRFVWDIKNLRRVHWRQQLLQEDYCEEQHAPAFSFEEISELKQLLLEAHLNHRERMYVDLRLAGYSQKEIAAFWQVSQPVVHRVKQRVIKKVLKNFI